jgi:hypothetical protein
LSWNVATKSQAFFTAMARTKTYPPVEQLGLIVRPPLHLDNYPMPIRWEATRRHPYYQALWKHAAPPSSGEGLGDKSGITGRENARLVLEQIGVRGVPLDPATPTDIVCGGESSFLSNTLMPISPRWMALALATTLPPIEYGNLFNIMGKIATLRLKGNPETWSQSPESVALLRQLHDLESPALDSTVDYPVVSVAVGASMNAILRDTRAYVRRWKQNHGIKSLKVHPHKAVKNLQVWDLREGWNGSGYDRSQERLFPTIAAQLKIRIQTAYAQYKNAFRLIVGCDFSPSVWWKVFAPLKVPGLSLDPAVAFTTVTRQVQKRLDRSHRDVPESRLQRGADTMGRSGIVTEKEVVDDEDEVDYSTKVAEILRLTDLGRPIEEIADKVECSAVAVKTVQEKRRELEAVVTPQP